MRRVILSLLLICLGSIYGFTEESNGKTGIGLGYPYLSVKHDVSEKISHEGRIAYLPGTIAGGGRLYYIFPKFEPIKNMKSFIGSEISLNYFNKSGVKGYGISGLIFIGAEYYFNRKFSFCLDLGPIYNILREIGNPSNNVSGLKLALNIGFYYYFKGGK